MSDFLDHLLAQVQPGAAAGIEPRAPSRFEPLRMAGGEGSKSDPVPEPVIQAPGAMPVAELSPLRPPKQARVEQPAVQEPAVAPRPAPVEMRIAPPPQAGEPPRRRRLPAEPAADAPVLYGAGAPQPAIQPPVEIRPYQVLVPVPGEVAAAEPGKIVHERTIRETLREIAPAKPAPAEASRPGAVEPLVPRADPPPFAAAAPVQPQLAPAIVGPELPEPPAPIVEVRIGRIEIHAPQPPAPAIEAAPLPAAAGPSRLDRYLARG